MLGGDKMKPAAAIMLLVAAALHLPGLQAQEMAVFEAPSVEAVEQGRITYTKWEDKAAAEHGVVNFLLGNTCFTTAMAQLGRECSRMDGPQRMWLAIQFTMCFQRASGFKPLNCPTACPKHKWLQSCVEECTARMDDKAHITYLAFFGDVFNMCLYLQSQDFQQRTAALVQEMHVSTLAANSSLGNIAVQLSRQEAALQHSIGTLEAVQQAQQQVVGSVQAGLREVQKIGEVSQGLQSSMAESLALTGSLSSRQLQLLTGFDDLQERHQQHAVQASAAWQQLAAGATALEQRQARYENLQAQLLNASEGLLHHSAGMSELLQVLLQYQHTGSSLLSHLATSSTSLQDLAFYSLALSVPLVFFTQPPDIRLLLLLSVGISWACERSVVQNYVALHRAVAGGGPPGVAASAAAATAGGSHAVKLAVRVLILGGGGCLVLVLLARRRRDQQRKEEVFEQIRQSMLQAPGPWFQSPAAAAAGAAAAGVGAGAGAGVVCSSLPQQVLLSAAFQPIQQHTAAATAAGITKPSSRGSKRAAAAPETSAAAPVLAAASPNAGSSLAVVLHAPSSPPAYHHHQQQQQQALAGAGGWLPHLPHHWFAGQPHVTTPALASPYSLFQQQQQQQQQYPATAAALLQHAPAGPAGANSSAAAAAAAAAAGSLSHGCMHQAAAAKSEPHPVEQLSPTAAGDAAAAAGHAQGMRGSDSSSRKQQQQRGRGITATKASAAATASGAGAEARGKAAGAKKRGRATAAVEVVSDAASDGMAAEEQEGQEEAAEADGRLGVVASAGTGCKTRKRQAR